MVTDPAMVSALNDVGAAILISLFTPFAFMFLWGLGRLVYFLMRG